MLHRATSDYGNITTISESKLRQGLLAVGTDDGLIQVTRNDGAKWTKVDAFAGVPEMTRVSRVVWSQHRESTLYATFDAHKDNNFLPYVLKSNDYGASWTQIRGDLPKFGSTRVVVEHPRDPNLLFVGTESAVFVSVTGGYHWVSLKNNMPTVPVHDMVIHPSKNDLVIGTHGRGFFILDDISVMEGLTSEVLDSDIHLNELRDTTQMHRYDRGRRYLGHSHFTAANPPNGAIITYYISPAVMKSVDEDGKDQKSDELPKVQIQVLDFQGRLVRSLEANQGSKGTGVQRLVWNLRLPQPYEPDPNASPTFLRNALPGPLVLPGNYQVRLRVGNREQLRAVRVKGDPLIDISANARKTWHDTLVTLGKMLEALKAALSTVQEIQQQVEQVTKALDRHPEAPDSLDAKVDQIKNDLREIRQVMLDDQTQGRAEQPGAPPLADQIHRLYRSIEAWTALPTQEQQQLTLTSYQKLDEQVKTINRLGTKQLPALHHELDRLGIRWTKGRLISLPPQGLLLRSP